MELLGKRSRPVPKLLSGGLLPGDRDGLDTDQVHGVTGSGG